MSAKIDLYTAGTPNGHKINIALHELGVPYNLHAISLPKNEQKTPDFLAINPNGRIPAIVDHSDGPPRRVFEGGAILLYLAQRFDRAHAASFPYDSPEHWEMVQWITWMQSGLGPMQGQLNHFFRYAPQKVQYAIDRYSAETHRLYQVLEDRLAEQEKVHGQPWTVGGRYSFADLARCVPLPAQTEREELTRRAHSFSWINWAEWAGVSLEKYPTLQRWLATIQARPATQAGVDVPEPFEMKRAMRTKEGAEEYGRMHSNWVMKGQDEEQQKHR